ncbi:MAG: hypothetical protein ACK56I_23005, partial [bacterium]
HDKLAHHVVPIVVQLCNLGNDAITVRLAKRGVIQAVEYDWSLWWKRETVCFNLWESCCHRRSVEDPSSFRHGVRDQADRRGRVREPVGIAAADEERRSLAAAGGGGGGEDKPPGQIRLGVHAQFEF